MSIRAREAVGAVSALPATSRGRFGISQHAIERCRQRVGPHLSDAGAAVLLGRLAAEGRAILMISSELSEILAMADRIIVMKAGAIAGTLTRREATENRLAFEALIEG